MDEENNNDAAEQKSEEREKGGQQYEDDFEDKQVGHNEDRQYMDHNVDADDDDPAAASKISWTIFHPFHQIRFFSWIENNPI